MMGLKMMALKPTRAAAKRESDRYSVEVKRPISRKRLRRSTRLLESRILRAKPNSTQTQAKPTNLDGFDFKVPPFKRPKTARAVSSSSEKLKKKIFEREVDEEEAAATEEDVGLETDDSQENETEKTNERVKKYSKKKRDTTGESLMCHQCQRNDKGRVINCKTCRRKRFCIPCITTWYPGMSEDEIADTCPACRDNCNCMSCLRKGGSTKKLKETLYLQFTEDEQVQHSKYLLQWLLPHIKHFSQEQMEEKVMEAKIQGVFPSELQLQQEFPAYNNRLYCGNCRTSIADYHRSCPRCNYVLCLICCREIREGHLQGGEKEVNIEYVDRGPAYAHGLARWKANENGSISCPPSPAYAHGLARWKANENGSISCPPKDLGGCGNDLLVLRSMFTENDVVELVEKAEAIAKDLNIETTLKSPKQKCLCYTSTGEIDFANSKPRKAASREDSTDNYLYCPTAKDIQNRCSKHFQMHWKKGEPVIVTNVLENTPGLSWEPFVLWRALRRIKSTKSEQHLNVKAIDCLYWSEVEINLHQFFKGYKDGRFDSNWPQILKLKDLPAFQKHLPRHHAEFLCCLPLKEYTHPYYGFLNLATKSSGIRPEPEMVIKLHIAYGLAQELVRGDSVIKLRCDMSDVVNVLVHAAEIKLTPEQLADITKAKVRHREQDLKELFGTRIKADGVKPDCCSTQNGVEDVEGGAIWDVFRREDVPKLRDYLNKHFREFRHIYCCPVQQVVDPIHDQSFYLTVDHKSKLKGEYGIEPWTFVQKLGEAVLIPAGCPYQVRNIKSCVKVSLDFVSPESIGECVRLTEEFRVLPHGHTAKVDKLEVRRMALRAMCSAVNRLDRNAWIKLSYSRQKKVATPGFRQGTLNSNPSGKHGVGRQVETEVDSIVTNDMEDPDSDEEDEVVHDQETEVQNEAVVRDPDEGRMVNDVKIEEVAIESGNDMDPDEDPDSDEEDEVVHDQETEVQNEAVVRDPDEVRMVNDVKIEEVAIESGNDMEDPDPIDTTAPTYPEEHAACSAQHTDCCIVDFYGFLVSTIHKPYLEVIYDIEGAFWKSCAIQSPEWISSLLRLFGDALKLSDTPWCLLSREDIVRMVRSIEDAKAVGFSVNCLEPLMEEARTMIASYDNCVGLKDQCSRVEEEIETVKGKLESLKNQRRELKRKMFTHSSTVGRSSTAFSFVSRVNYTLVGSPKWESA